MTALLLAALSAVLYGAGVAFEHRQAAGLPAQTAGRPRMLALLARQPWWLAGVALEAVGFAAHAAALRTGSLAAVQLVLGCSLLVSIAVSSALARRTLPRYGWPAMLAIVTAVGAMLTLLGPDDHTAGQGPGRLGLAALVTGGITIPFAAAGLLATRPRRRALLLAVAAGLADTCAAVVTMAFTRSLAPGLGAAATSWPLYALIVAGLASLALAQAAYQTDTPLITLPTITVVMPLASLAVSIIALHETAHLNGARIVIMMVCLAVAVTALAGLARAADSAGTRPMPRTPGTPRDAADPAGLGAPVRAVRRPRHHPSHPGLTGHRSGRSRPGGTARRPSAPMTGPRPQTLPLCAGRVSPRGDPERVRRHDQQGTIFIRG